MLLVRVIFLLKHKTMASVLEEKSGLRNKRFARLDEQLRQFWLGFSKRYVGKVSGKLSAEKLPWKHFHGILSES